MNSDKKGPQMDSNSSYSAAWNSSVISLPSYLSRQWMKATYGALVNLRGSIPTKYFHASKTKLCLSTSSQSSCRLTSHPTSSQSITFKTNLKGTWMVHVFLNLAWILQSITKLLVSTNASPESRCINRLTKISCYRIVLYIMNLPSISPEAQTQETVVSVCFISQFEQHFS